MNRKFYVWVTILLFSYALSLSSAHARFSYSRSSTGTQNNAQNVDYYKVLSLQDKREEATESDIKQSYRRLSRQYHPDVAKSEEDKVKYAQINRAYEVLSNKRMRKMYDMRGEAGLEQLKQAAAAGDRGASMNPFAQLFGFSSGNSLYGQKQEKFIEVDLSTIFRGGTVFVRHNKQIVCKHCKGRGDDPTSPIVLCSQCQGRGVVEHRLILAPGMYQEIRQMCSHCNGNGKKAQRSCPACRGRKVAKGDIDLKVDIEAGTPENHPIVFEMEADESPDLIPGDLVVRVRSRPHPQFTRMRNGLDLEMSLSITLKEALLGVSREFKNIDGKEVIKLNRVNTTPYGTVIKIAGKGMPKLHLPSERGDLYVRIKFEMPASLSTKQREALEKCL
ncbi:unnamed protein product [Phytomonas sp. EM1]|nr:unnamed protein product [Phytomonas sp. EM1]|eukprot:CCW60316.1 unnamed protein product [Phytomonas sp. isolate EM1]